MWDKSIIFKKNMSLLARRLVNAVCDNETVRQILYYLAIPNGIK